MSDMPVSNWIPLGMTAAFVLAAFLLPIPDGILGHVVLAAGALLVGAGLFATGIVGGGVVKYFAASSLWIGPNQAFLTFSAITLIGGGLLAFAVMKAYGRTASVPILPAMLLGFVLALPQAPVWQALTAGPHPNF